jgi:TRAP-type uncharacterized transport system substrate-binding protein
MKRFGAALVAVIVEATAEVTAGSIANLQLIGGGKSEVGFTMPAPARPATPPT